VQLGTGRHRGRFGEERLEDRDASWSAPCSITIGVVCDATRSLSKIALIESGEPPSVCSGSSGRPAQTLGTAPGSSSATETLTVITCTESAAVMVASSATVAGDVGGEVTSGNRHVRAPVVVSMYDSAVA
jgi:hypothetical protein